MSAMYAHLDTTLVKIVKSAPTKIKAMPYTEQKASFSSDVWQVFNNHTSPSRRGISLFNDRKMFFYISCLIWTGGKTGTILKRRDTIIKTELAHFLPDFRLAERSISLSRLKYLENIFGDCLDLFVIAMSSKADRPMSFLKVFVQAIFWKSRMTVTRNSIWGFECF